MPEETEPETRKKHVDRKLEAVGWVITKHDRSKLLSTYLSNAIEEHLYNCRTNIGITKKERHLTSEHFREFEACYGTDPNVAAVSALEKRGEMAEKTERFKKFSIEEIKKRDYNLDIFWLKDELAGEAITNLEATISGLQEVLFHLGEDNNESEVT